MLLNNYRTVANYELRMDGEHDDDDVMPTLEITFARFNVWNEIYSWREGRFLEMIAPGAFTQTFADRAGSIKCLFNHGRDPVVGDKPLGAVTQLRETTNGPVGDVPLFDSTYVRDLLPGLQSEPPVYGASYRFGVYYDEAAGVIGESWDREPGVSAHNPDGLPERTLTRLNVSEFGPVTFPADEGTIGLTGVRSLDDRFAPKDLSAPAEVPAAGALGPANADDQARNAVAFGLANRRRKAHR